MTLLLTKVVGMLLIYLLPEKVVGVKYVISSTQYKIPLSGRGSGDVPLLSFLLAGIGWAQSLLYSLYKPVVPRLITRQQYSQRTVHV